MLIVYHRHTVTVSSLLPQTAEELQFMAKYAPFAQPKNLAMATANYILSDPRLPARQDITVRIDDEEWQLTRTILKEDHPPWGRVDILWEEENSFGVYRLIIYPGQTIPMHHHAVMTEKELILTAGLHAEGGRRLEPLTLRQWNQFEPHAYHNGTAEPQMILCIDMPPFIPQDEIATSSEL